MKSKNDYAAKFEERLRRLEGDPEYVFEGLQFDIMEQMLALMETRGMSRSQLARELGCSDAYVTKLLKGTQNLTLRTLFDVSRALGGELRVSLKEGASRKKAGGSSAGRTDARSSKKRAATRVTVGG